MHTFSRLKKFPWYPLKSTCFWVHKEFSYYIIMWWYHMISSYDMVALRLLWVPMTLPQKGGSSAIGLWFFLRMGQYSSTRWPKFGGRVIGSILEVHKELSNSDRAGIEKKLKCMAQPYKTKVLNKKKCRHYIFFVPGCRKKMSGNHFMKGYKDP